MIVAVSSPRDGHATAVLQSLRQVGANAALLDLSDFPKNLSVAMHFNGDGRSRQGTPEFTLGDLDLSAPVVIWWRRPGHFCLHDEIVDPVYRSFAYSEADAALSGLWLALDAFWVNHPTREAEASRKVYQLKLAQKLGFAIPTTLVSNNPAEVHTFVQTYGHEQVVYKAFSGTEQAWRETRIMHESEVEFIEAVKFAPVIFQEYIPARVDLRVTVVGDEVFPAAIYSQETSYKFDYRMDMDHARVEPFPLPDAEADRLRRYMSHLGLVYGAIDLRLTPDDRIVFLEINPSGQWLFIEHRTGQPITEALVRLLVAQERFGPRGSS